jgi:hypothetical protein
MLLNGKKLCEYLGIEADTLRRIRREDPTFPGFFIRKLYSKPEIDAWLRRRLPAENHSENNKIDINAMVDTTLAEMFGGNSLSSPVEETSPQRMPVQRASA